MTTLTDRTRLLADAQAAANIIRISAELEEARADMTLIDRLKSAADRVKRLSGEQDKAIAARNKALAAEAKAKQEARFAGISDMRITCVGNEHLLRLRFTIEYMSPRWNGFESVPARRSFESFDALPSDVLDYIIEVRPDLIPAMIADLAPGSPREAFGRYFLGKKRGYIAA
jgi:hypothetical protein